MKYPYTPIEMAPDDEDLDFNLIEWAVKSYREGRLVRAELKHFLLLGLRIELPDDIFIIGSYCGISKEKK